MAPLETFLRLGAWEKAGWIALAALVWLIGLWLVGRIFRTFR